MTLKKQSIRGLEAILLNGQSTTKEELISLSEHWSENEELAVRKVLKQGGKCKVGNDIISVTRPDEHYSLVR